MFLIIETSTNDSKTAGLISKSLLNRKLSPCIQIVNSIESSYIWNEKIVKDKEIILRIKSIPSNIDKITKTIIDAHNYDNPEIISYPFDILSKKYKKWFTKNCQYVYKK